MKLITAFLVCWGTFAWADEAEHLFNSLGPWPPEIKTDTTNRYSGNPEAIEFGRRLFGDRRLSSDWSLTCASCHQPDHGYAEPRDRSVGQAKVDRNTQALANLSEMRWFGWVGQSDTLWGQSIRPLLDEKELALSAPELQSRISQSDDLDPIYASVFGAPAENDLPVNVLVNVAKALAAYQETLRTPETAFDAYWNAKQNGEDHAGFSESAKRGLDLFLGKGGCALCHFGTNFSNGAFHDTGLGHFLEDGRVDQGRHGGLAVFLDNAFTGSGDFSDAAPEDKQSKLSNFVIQRPDDWGAFRVPSLRNVANTAPYMHDGSLATLRDVIEHYNAIDQERLHTNSATLLKPLNLTETEKEDLEIFLHSLSGNPVPD